MKKSIILLALIITSCTNDKDCSKIKQFKISSEASYIVLENGNEILIKKGEIYKIGQEYCQ